MMLLIIKWRSKHKLRSEFKPRKFQGYLRLFDFAFGRSFHVVHSFFSMFNKNYICFKKDKRFSLSDLDRNEY